MPYTDELKPQQPTAAVSGFIMLIIVQQYFRTILAEQIQHVKRVKGNALSEKPFVRSVEEIWSSQDFNIHFMSCNRTNYLITFGCTIL